MDKVASAVVISEQDNVATATRNINAGEKVRASVGSKTGEFSIKDNIKFLHKFATQDIRKGEKVLKYGGVIGEATRNIGQGEHVHTHNVRSLRA